MEKLAISKFWNYSEYHFKVEDIFFSNLAPKTSIEVIQQGLSSAEKAVHKITLVEDILIEVNQNFNSKLFFSNSIVIISIQKDSGVYTTKQILMIGSTAELLPEKIDII